MQQEADARLSAQERHMKQEAESEANNHEQSKTMHYSKLGGTFVNKGSILGGNTRGTAGRGSRGR